MAREVLSPAGAAGHSQGREPWLSWGPGAPAPGYDLPPLRRSKPIPCCASGWESRSLRDVNPLGPGLLAQGGAHGGVERLVAGRGVLLHLLADVRLTLPGQFRDLLLQRLALRLLLLQVGDALLRLELAQFLGQLVLR